MAARIVDITGKKFGMLTAIRSVGPSASRGLIWEFRCDCGRNAELNGNEVRRGKIKRCPECAKKVKLRAVTTHGKTQQAEYRIWCAMKSRCYNQKSFQYRDYGGRGIAVCDRWRDSFENFLADMGERPSKHHSIDRFPDNDGNYGPGNCRWATKGEQSNNKRNNRKIKISGISKNLCEWALYAGITESVIRSREKRGLTGKDLIAPSISDRRIL